MSMKNKVKLDGKKQNSSGKLDAAIENLDNSNNSFTKFPNLGLEPLSDDEAALISGGPRCHPPMAGRG